MFNTAEILSTCRKYKKMSRFQLSLESSVSKSTIEQIECGTRDPRVETFEKLLNALGYELEVLQKDE